MWRGLALVLAVVALGSTVAVARTDAAVMQGVRNAVRAEVQRINKAAKPARRNAPHRSRSRQSAMAALENAVVGRMNSIRRTHGLRPLRSNSRLRAAAEFHSKDMGRRGYFEHDSISGTPFWRRIERFYPSRGFNSWTVGENLLWGTNSYNASFAVREWMESPPHRENILSPSWREVGIGAVRFARAPGAYGGRTVTIVTADFGSRR